MHYGRDNALNRAPNSLTYGLLMSLRGLLPRYRLVLIYASPWSLLLTSLYFMAGCGRTRFGAQTEPLGFFCSCSRWGMRMLTHTGGKVICWILRRVFDFVMNQKTLGQDILFRIFFFIDYPR